MNSENRERLAREQSFHDHEVGEKNIRKGQNKYYADLNYVDVYRREEIGDLQGKVVLDYGCGIGDSAIRYLQQGAIVYAIDISPVLIEKLKKRARELQIHHNLYAFPMNAEELEFENDFFDLVIGNGILHHLNVKKACQEISRVLKSTGRAIFLEPLGMNPIVNLYRNMTPKSRTVDEKPFTKEEFTIIKENFANYKVKYFECTTLISMFLLAMRLKKVSKISRKLFEKMDRAILNNRFMQKYAWIVVITMKK